MPYIFPLGDIGRQHQETTTGTLAPATKIKCLMFFPWGDRGGTALTNSGKSGAKHSPVWNSFPRSPTSAAKIFPMKSCHDINVFIQLLSDFSFCRVILIRATEKYLTDKKGSKDSFSWHYRHCLHFRLFAFLPTLFHSSLWYSSSALLFPHLKHFFVAVLIMFALILLSTTLPQKRHLSPFPLLCSWLRSSALAFVK